MANGGGLRQYGDYRYEITIEKIAPYSVEKYRYAAKAVRFERVFPEGRVEAMDDPHIGEEYGHTAVEAREALDKAVSEWVDGHRST